MPRHIPFPLTYQGQLVTLVLAALHEMRGVQSKQKTIAYIDAHGWFDLQPGDETVYPSHKHTNNEPRWHTWVAFGRQWAVERDLMSHFEARDRWEISPGGIQRFDTVRGKLKAQQYEVRRGY